MTTHSDFGRVEANVQHRVRLTDDDATLITQSSWRREEIRVDMIVEMLAIHFQDGAKPSLQYTVRAYGPIQTQTTKRDHATRRGDISWRNRDQVPMVLLKHLWGEAVLHERLAAVLHGTEISRRDERGL